ncbi:hypothetical protein CON65_11245 [Bacillus pseudomycoides]|uniref:Uncharacterized protein n=1 Tax=Bacillus pseudomycoides TaxID=64104 RepID=A0AA91VC99_9BACI|nr:MULTISPECIES: hypothetical protein [Bacillus]PEB47552.1 hypothetical protein COO03_25855 [Bacillus sp. AFS098217]PED82530.1 hypothetical protein CON65_11245 [Bacillus pseudomycoides]PEU11531.1 hypothetical protein CN525_22005 [Bacillus sp. AFS014408]PEU17276.1 hypothetical protein CN524_02740 [Bacillus sp. AFS019443]PFW60727.1 hypothetical protein COL20_20765 [Bacillus sp. AFS075034]
MTNCYFEFLIHKEAYFHKLRECFYKLKEEKEKEMIDSSDSMWLEYFDEDVLKQFWWPTEEELHNHWILWEQTPVEERLREPKLETPWDFESMIDTFACGEYELVFCEKVSNNIGRIEFYPNAWPYGGSDVFRALIEYSGFKIIDESA